MSDDMQELKRQAEQNIYSFLQADGSGKGVICPVCQSGSGKKGTGMTQDPQRPGRYHCWACGLDCDVIELIGRTQTNSENRTEITKTACEHIRKTLGIKSQFKADTQMIQSTHNTHTTQNMYNTQNTQKDPIKEKAALEQIKRTIKEAEKHLSECAYLTRRGISEKTAKRFHIGFCAKWQYPGKAMAEPEPRIIIPLNEHTYTARTTWGSAAGKYIKVGGNAIFNPDALFDYTQPCFITEGEINALSIIEAGYNACALGGSQNTKMLVNELISRTPTHLILYLDNDDAGKRADIKLQETLAALGISYTTITGTDKLEPGQDANDFLVRSKSDFQQYLAEAQAKANNALLAEKNEYVSDNNVSGYVDDFLNDVAGRATTPCVPTGFRALDKVLDGGLYEGLYILGALSSLGKTTLILQIADQMSEQGHDVMFFSLEQSRHELIAKSLSRGTAQICERQGDDLTQNPKNARTIRDITNSKRHDKFDSGQLETLTGAIGQYREKGKNLYIIEGLGDIGVKDIRAAVERHIRATGNKPVVFVDYLQIMATPDEKNRSDKQVVDTNISDLKRLSRDLKLTIFGISSFNRESYSTNVGMSAFKESGAIEYSSDVLIGLQFADIDYSKQTDSGKQSIKDQIAEAKNKNPRPVQLVILKNRNGALGEVEFEYFPAYNLYKEKIKW